MVPAARSSLYIFSFKMRKFFLKILIFSLPFLLYIGYSAYEVLVLPINFYTFRAWEALTVFSNNSILSGPFYPNSHLKMIEEGDLGHREGFSVEKPVEWFVDKHGFRKKNTGKKKHEIVIIGDSYIAGATLSQEETLSEQLEKKLGVSVYPYAPKTFNDYIQDKRFLDNPPDIVIFEAVEKLILHVPYPNTDLKPKPTLFDEIKFSKAIQNPAIALDRLKKRQLFNFLYAKLEDIPKEIILKLFASPKAISASEPLLETEAGTIENFGLNVGKGGKMIFARQADEYFVEATDRSIKIDGLDKFIEYKDWLSKKGTKFILLPIPNKENIYFEDIIGGRKVTNLRRLIDVSKKSGLITIDTQALYENKERVYPNRLLYHLDDTHWTAYGVEVVTEELAKIIKGTIF